jgi:hypothetical protein
VNSVAPLRRTVDRRGQPVVAQANLSAVTAPRGKASADVVAWYIVCNFVVLQRMQRREWFGLVGVVGRTGELCRFLVRQAKPGWSR